MSKTTDHTVHVPARAKLNLFLHVGPRQEDDYHPLQSLVAFTDLGDDLHLVPSKDLTLTIEGPFAPDLSAENAHNNLVMKAAFALADWTKDHGISVSGAHLTLHKKLPVASGIGGGSADAAAALRGLCELWQLDPPAEELMKLALSLGADVPVCLHGCPTLMSGIGEQLTDLHGLPDIHVVLVNHGQAMSTAKVFHEFDKRGSRPVLETQVTGSLGGFEGLLGFLNNTRNDLQAPAIALLPEIARVLDSLKNAGAPFARMSGSGATCFALFSNKDDAQACAEKLRKDHPQWWIETTFLCRH